MMFLKRWTFCFFSNEHLGPKTWKQFFLIQVKQEYHMALAQPEDFTCKEVSENLRILRAITYFSGSGLSMDGKETVQSFAVSLTFKLFTWDVQKGAMIWVSLVQQSLIKHVMTLPQRHFTFIGDLEGTSKVWNCRDGDALAAFTVSWCCFSMEAFLTEDGPFLMMGDYEGDVYSSDFRCISRVNTFRYCVALLLYFPDKKWIFASGYHQHVFPVVFPECLLKQSEADTPLPLPIPFAWCGDICWASRKTNRITVMFQKGSHKKTMTTFDFTAECSDDKSVTQAQKIASFPLPFHMKAPNYIGINDRNMIVFESGPHLFLFTISGLLLQWFENHQRTICYLSVDPIPAYVLTISMDNSLHVYMWTEGHYPHLRIYCHLEQVAGDRTTNWFASTAMCDNLSIVCVMTRNRESNILVMYPLNV
ncbi:LOW QUALITY PROTEIN: F-box/WD repeat-containing protein 12-like [Trichechus inunguis]